jgi:anti-anti-sigma regulatory factor
MVSAAGTVVEAMKTSGPGLTVCLVNGEAWLKVSGRANFNYSVDFKTVVGKLREQGYKAFVLDLTDCLLMDSTFLGVLAGLGLKFGQGSNGEREASIELLNPNERIADLLENLGVNQLFNVRTGPPLSTEGQACIDPGASCSDKKELTRTCLEAHETLMNINPANVPKFKDVARFLAEDLKRLEEPNGDKPENNGNSSPAPQG